MMSLVGSNEVDKNFSILMDLLPKTDSLTTSHKTMKLVGAKKFTFGIGFFS